MTAAVVGPMLAIVCIVMALAAALIYRAAQLGSAWVAPGAALRATVQLAAVSTVLALAITRLWSSIAVLTVMFGVACMTAASRARAGRSSAWVVLPLAAGLTAVLPLLLLTGLVPATGIAVVPIVGIILGGTMTAVAVAAKRALDALQRRVGEVEAALSLGLTERDSRREVVVGELSDALLPNLDQTRTAGLVTLPGAFVGVLLSTGSATQAGAVQVLVLISLLLSQTCGVAVVGELVARGRINRSGRVSPAAVT